LKGTHHFFTEPDAVAVDTVALSGPEAHHAAKVLRVRAGERITVADGTGRVVEAVVTKVGDVVRGSVTKVHHASRPVPELVLCQAIARADRMDEMIRRAAEMGVMKVIPFIAERTIVRWNEAKRDRNRERWEALTLSAAKQSRSPWITKVDHVASDVSEVASTVDSAVVLHEGAATRLRDVLPAHPPATLGVVIGPEGGLSPNEVETLRTAGAQVVTLGDRILRTETAGVAVAAIVGYVYGTLG
jgi:16S rRNA (uracil1498-N3)-methyltransferase